MQTLFLILTTTLSQTRADLTIFTDLNSSTPLFTSTSCYTPQQGSRQHFPSTSRLKCVFVGDLCDHDLPANYHPPTLDTFVFFTADSCDEAIPLEKFVNANVGEGVTIGFLYDPDAGKTVHDQPTRYVFDPRPAQKLVNIIRVHGGESKTVRDLLVHAQSSNQVLYAVGTWVTDPWITMVFAPYYIIYDTIEVFFFIVYVPQHAVRCLWKMHVQAKSRMSVGGATLTRTVMINALLLGCVRFVDDATQIIRDYFAIWVPEVISQLAWGYGYMILLLNFAMLIFYWSDLLKNTKVKMAHINAVSARWLIFFSVIVFIGMTAMISCWVYTVPGAPIIKAVGFAALGFIAIVEAFTAMYYGGKIIYALRDFTPVHQRTARAGSMTSPAGTASIVAYDPPTTNNVGQIDIGSSAGTAADNPLFDTSHRKSQKEEDASLTPTSTSPKRSSLVGTVRTISTRLGSFSGEPRDAETIKKQKQAMARARPMTRLVVVTAFLLICGAILSLVTVLSPVQESPNTYWIIFYFLMVIEITIYGLILVTLSPIWAERRRKTLANQGGSGSGLMKLGALSEEPIRQKKWWARFLWSSNGGDDVSSGMMSGGGVVSGT